jgi:hypothetical protein
MEDFSYDFSDNLNLFNFNSLESPLDWKARLIIKSEVEDFNYIKINWVWNAFTINECFDDKEYNFSYSDEYFDIENTKCLSIKFEKDYFENNVVDIEFWSKNMQIIESQYCYDPEIPDVITINWNEITDEEIINQIKEDWVYDIDWIWYNPANKIIHWFNLHWTWSLVLWSVQGSQWVVWNTCEMFNDQWTFLYYSNWSIGFEFSDESYEFFYFEYLDFSWTAKFTFDTLVAPLNSFISILWIMTPFTEYERNYCLFWIVVPYENHKLYELSEYYNKMNFISYMLLFSLYMWIFWLFFWFRNYMNWWVSAYKEEKWAFRKANNNRLLNKNEKVRLEKRIDNVKNAKDFAKNNK